ncbi:MAG: Maf family protein [Anaerolineae bacterium]
MAKTRISGSPWEKKPLSAIRGVTLASASPRREQLLRVMGLPFAVRPVDISEAALPGERPWDMVVRLSLEKALAAAPEPGFDIVVGSDTVVTLTDGSGTMVLGKPRDRSEIAEMLGRLGGREHSVYTGVAVRDTGRGRSAWGAERVRVHLRRLDDAEMRAYCESGIGDDKAGAYAVQDRDFSLVQTLNGCASAAMGLPLCLLRRALRDLGIPVPPEDAVARECSILTGAACCLGQGPCCPEVVVYGKEGC